MKQTTYDSIRRILTRGFTVQDIAEPLASFDDHVDAAGVRQYLERLQFEVVGVRVEGRVVGYVHRDDLKEGTCRDFMRPFSDEDVIPETENLAEVIVRLSHRSFVFVSLVGAVGAIVARGDLIKPPVRMWLFGLVTIIELRFSRLIELQCPDDSWRKWVSPSRLAKAEQLCEERRRRHQHVRVFDCLQLADKGQIMIRHEKLREILQMPSRRHAESLLKQLESLRNNLAHAQDIVTSDWETIVLLADNLERIISGPSTHRHLLEKRPLQDI